MHVIEENKSCTVNFGLEQESNRTLLIQLTVSQELVD